jgi:hypothetical protein
MIRKQFYLLHSNSGRLRASHSAKNILTNKYSPSETRNMSRDRKTKKSIIGVYTHDVQRGIISSKLWFNVINTNTACCTNIQTTQHFLHVVFCYNLGPIYYGVVWRRPILLLAGRCRSSRKRFAAYLMWRFTHMCVRAINEKTHKTN